MLRRRTRRSSKGTRRRGRSISILASVCFMAAIASQVRAAEADPLPPTITAFTPAAGPTEMSVTIHGSGFSTAAATGAVAFGGTVAGAYTIDSDTQITAAVPRGAPSGPITVTTSGGTVASDASFQVTLSITGLTPDSGPVGTPVSISGRGFSTTPVRSVRFGGLLATRFTVDSDTQITARIPAGAPDGAVSVGTDTATVDSQGTMDVTLRHIVEIVMENTSLVQIDGNTSAAYVNNCLIHRDLGRCPDAGTGFPTANYTQSYAANHAGSLYAYLDLTSGSDPHTQGGVCNFSILGCPDTDRNIVDQLEAAGLSWASYAEDYPAPGTCSLTEGVKRVGASDIAYGAGHVPFLHYTDIRSNPARCTHFFGNPSGLTKAGLPIGGDAGLKQLTTDLANGNLPAFAFITPNEYSDMHTGCSSGICPPGAPNPISMGDQFLAYWIPHLMAGLGPDDRILVTWDEGSFTDAYACCVVPGGPKIDGGHIPTFVIGGTVVQGSVPTPVTSYSFLTAIEDTFSLPGNIPGATATQAHQLNQLYAICGCTPLVRDPSREGPPPGGVDSDPPTTPGKPTGSSPSFRTIMINWAASTDASPPITYRIYRDGNLTAVGSTTSTSFTDTGLAPGSYHTYTVDAVDGHNNGPSQMSPASYPITVPTVDTDPPTAPGKPTGSSPTSGTIMINWAASTDASPPITYRIYRDGNPTAIGSTISTSFTDSGPGLTPGSSHTYTVDAVDSLNNPPSQMSPTSDPIGVAAASAIFSDGFASGDLSNWTGSTRLTIDNSNGGVAPPSARAQTTAQTAFAYKNLSGTLSTICMSASVNATSRDAVSTTLLRLRTAANGPIVRVFANPAGIMYVRSDASNMQLWSGVALGTGWHNVELCGTVGTSGTWDLYRDGVKIVNTWVANTGTTPVGRMDIGNTQAVTATINFDDIVVDQTPG